ncbi:MAG: hypothetical protein HC824_18680 [Synechococcales cyanobacterium RM1_1_8]|nr:hypothetical protein [Synechococcales cyanobacterium RM1_1_8]
MAKGDHLYVSRGTYFHHGIDCGDGTVVHYREGEAITRSSLPFFALGSPVLIKSYDQADAADQVVTRACSRIGERDYHVVFNNCEHFATWCKTGDHRSDQVTTVAAAVGLGGLLLGGPVAVPAIAAASLYGIAKHLEQAQAQAAQDPTQAQRAWDSALASLEQLSQDQQAELAAGRRECDRWQRTAQLALQQGREDLARAALEKKYPLSQKLKQLQAQWEETLALQRQLQRQGEPQLQPQDQASPSDLPDLLNSAR